MTTYTVAVITPAAFDEVTIGNTSRGVQFSAFAQANRRGTSHLWNYGSNVWGWEDRPNGGDRDDNDMVVQIDFTSASGSGWLK
jgi:hypothetical protein